MKNIIVVLFLLALVGCEEQTQEGSPSDGSSYTIELKDMKRIDVGDGEVVYQAEGKHHGMNDMSFVITETKVGGGPPLHVHPTEEAHVVLNGTVTYFIADSIFTVTAPYIVNIPPNTPHTFINSGDTVLNLIGAFGHDNYGPYKPIGKNPLIKE